MLDITKVGTAIKNKAGMFGLKVKVKSPEILLGLGLVCMVGGVVTAAFAGKKQEDIAEDHLDRLKKAKETDIEVEVTTKNESGEEVKETQTVVKSEKEVKKAVFKVYRDTAVKEAKCWGPTVMFVTAAAGCFVSSRNIQARRITGLSLANAGLQEAFRKYQENNIALNGEEVHQMCKNGFKVTKEEETENENGGKTIVRDTEPKTAEEVAQEYVSGIFYEHKYSFDMWHAPTTYRKNTSSMFNYNFLDSVEKSVQNIVDARGYCSADEAARMLGLERDENQIIIDLQDGWFRGGEPVRFGHRDPINNASVAGYGNKEIILEFNVHGNLAYLLDQQAKAQKKVYEDMKAKKVTT